MASDIDTRHTRSVFVRADGVGVLAVKGSCHDYVEYNREDHKPNNRHHSRSDKGIRVGREGYRVTARPPQRDAAADQEHTQCRDEGRDAQISDEGAVDGPDQRAECDAYDDRHDDR